MLDKEKALRSGAECEDARLLLIASGNPQCVAFVLARATGERLTVFPIPDFTGACPTSRLYGNFQERFLPQ